MEANKYLKSILLLLFSVIIAQTYAQGSKPAFAAYSRFVSKVFDISWKCPKGFIDLQTAQHWRPNAEHASTLDYNALFQSKDSDCVMMYPRVETFYFPQLKHQTLNTTHLIWQDLGLPTTFNCTSEDVMEEFERQVTVWNGTAAKQRFNADTVYLCTIPLAQPYRGKYPHCIGIYACKKNRPSLYFKCFFTEEGKKKKDAYLNALYRTVRYRKGDWRYDDRKSGKERYKIYKKRRT